jgi:exodeoxyribonuclease VII small subunit
MSKKEITYTEAIREVETILDRLNSETADVDTLAESVRRASELIALCKEKLRTAEAEVARAIQKEPEA